MHLSGVWVCVCACRGVVGGREGVWGHLNAGVAHVHMRCMSDDRSRQHGKYKIGQLLKMHCAERTLREVCLEKTNCRHSFDYKIAVVFCL